jgi:hypothetical protein
MSEKEQSTELKDKLQVLKSRIDRLDSFKEYGIDATKIYESNKLDRRV